MTNIQNSILFPLMAALIILCLVLFLVPLQALAGPYDHLDIKDKNGNSLCVNSSGELDPNVSAFCQTCDQLYLVDSTACETSESTFNELFEALLETMIYVIGAISVLAVVLGGGMYVFSQGEAANIKRAKDIITYAVIGLVVAIVARAAVFFVVGRI